MKLTLLIVTVLLVAVGALAFHRGGKVGGKSFARQATTNSKGAWAEAFPGFFPQLLNRVSRPIGLSLNMVERFLRF